MSILAAAQRRMLVCGGEGEGGGGGGEHLPACTHIVPAVSHVTLSLLLVISHCPCC